MDMEKSPNPTIPPIPHEVLCHHILIRLPVKILVRFSCVCKLWRRSITTDQDFIKSHLQNKVPRNIMLYSPPGYPDYENSGSSCLSTRKRKRLRNLFAEVVLAKGWANIGVGNSLVCCYDGVFCMLMNLWCGGHLDRRISLWNPALRQHILLPRTMVKCIEVNAIGYVFDDSSEDYKVITAYTGVKFTANTKCLNWRVDVYSLRSHSWTTIDSRESRAIPICSSLDELNRDSRVDGSSSKKGIVLGGCFYWFDRIWQARNRPALIYLHKVDLARANGRETSILPVHISISFYTGCRLTIFKGCISLCGVGGNGPPFEFEVWSMMDSGWIKRFVVKPTNLSVYPGTSNSRSRVLAAPKASDGRAVGPLVLYDFENQTIDDNVPAAVPLNGGFSFQVADNYVESLVSIVPPTTKRKLQHTRFLRKLFGWFVCRN